MFLLAHSDSRWRQLQGHGRLKGKPDIGDQINKKIIAPLANANKLSDVPDFNDEDKLGKGKEMVDRLTKLIGIFEDPDLDFPRNRADGDDLLGDAYEYLIGTSPLRAARARTSSTPRRSQPSDRADHRHRQGEDHQRYHSLRPDLWVWLPTPEGGR